ncbi:MAG TPA: type II toxin-antitoxin system HicA family toxin [Longimicrobium sp.]|nr:type II toxin-antitoxin system HicA family toxin [Longimicrobium sp.]
MTVPELIQAVETNGWLRVRLRGPHRQYTHPGRPGVLTLRRHLTDEVAPGAVHSVLAQAGVAP